MHRPLVSVIIPVYNGQQYLAAAIDSVLEQDYRPLEIIVVDDGSTDESARIAQSYSEVLYLYQANGGAAAARNTGIAAAHGEIIAFLDHDDLWTPNKLQVHVTYLLEHPEVAFTISTGVIYLDEGVERPEWLSAEELVHPQQLLGALVVHKETFNELGELDTTFKVAEDTEWLMRARDAGHPWTVLPEPVVLRRVHGDNLSTRFRGQHQLSMLRALQKSAQRKRNKLQRDSSDT
jgi:glycosyltransferase involved in cell wall biosynthesis